MKREEGVKKIEPRVVVRQVKDTREFTYFFSSSFLFHDDHENKETEESSKKGEKTNSSQMVEK